MDLTVKEFSNDDVPKIMELYKKVFDKYLLPAFWNWRFVNNPFGKLIAFNAFHKAEIVSHYIVHPIKLEINSKKFDCVFSMNTMTDTQYRKKGIITKLAKKTYEKCKPTHYAVIGFSNNNFLPILKKLGFSDLKQMNEIIIQTNSLNISLQDDYKITNIDFFDKSFLELYESFQKIYNKTMIPRTSDYLNWRFINHPSEHYFCYKISKNNNLIGYFVLKNFNGQKAHLVDFLLLDIVSFEAMILKSLSFCKENNLNNITFWLNKKNPLYKTLKKFPFSEIPMEIHFVVKSLISSTNKELLNFDNWFITMSDSDVF